jgi:ribosomal protein S18 acetylase RimI-like enzyme
MDRARAMGARELYLRTSRELEDAVRLYRRVGFKRISRNPFGFCRMCRDSITMKIDLARKA